MASPRPYRAPWWLPGGHLQTVYPYLFLRNPVPSYRRERIETPDGDFIDLDWVDASRNVPTVVLFHGLEGGSRSHYARNLLRAVSARGWRGVVAHFRGCSGIPNRLRRAYHSGDADEIDWILRLLKDRTTNSILAVGVSLGGNALLKWLAPRGPGRLRSHRGSKRHFRANRFDGRRSPPWHRFQQILWLAFLAHPQTQRRAKSWRAFLNRIV